MDSSLLRTVMRAMMMLLMVCLYITPASGFVIVSPSGDITFLGNVDIDPQLEDARINMKTGGETKWTLQTKASLQPTLRGQYDFVIRGGMGPSDMLRLTSDSQAIFDTTLSVSGHTVLGDALSVMQETSLGGSLSVTGVVDMGDQV